MSNPWLDRRVLNYAHQGGAKESPSSTLFALEQALAAGADALELDVHATADRELVVCHDSTVDRTTEASGRIADMSLADVQALDNAYWFVPGEVVAPGRPAADYPHRGRSKDDARFRVATLREVLQAFPATPLNLDIKQTAPDVVPYEAELAALLREHGRGDDVIVASFLDIATESFGAMAPEISTSCGTNTTVEFWQAIQAGKAVAPTRHHALQVPATMSGVEVVDARFVERAHEAGLAVHVWTIDDDAEMEQLLGLGVDGIMTDCPTVLEGVLNRCGAPRPAR